MLIFLLLRLRKQTKTSSSEWKSCDEFRESERKIISIFSFVCSEDYEKEFSQHLITFRELASSLFHLNFLSWANKIRSQSFSFFCSLFELLMLRSSATQNLARFHEMAHAWDWHLIRSRKVKASLVTLSKYWFDWHNWPIVLMTKFDDAWELKLEKVPRTFLSLLAILSNDGSLTLWSNLLIALVDTREKIGLAFLPYRFFLPVIFPSCQTAAHFDLFGEKRNRNTETKANSERKLQK